MRDPDAKAPTDPRVTTGEGFAITNVDELGEGFGLRKIRVPLGVTAFGINAIVLPPGREGSRHFHDVQQEVYFVHAGTAEFEFGDGSCRRVGPGGVVRVDPTTIRTVRNAGDDDVVFVCVGGDDGYVGRDGHKLD